MRTVRVRPASPRCMRFPVVSRNVARTRIERRGLRSSPSGHDPCVSRPRRFGTSPHRVIGSTRRPPPTGRGSETDEQWGAARRRTMGTHERERDPNGATDLKCQRALGSVRVQFRGPPAIPGQHRPVRTVRVAERLKFPRGRRRDLPGQPVAAPDAQVPDGPDVQAPDFVLRSPFGAIAIEYVVIVGWVESSRPTKR